MNYPLFFTYNGSIIGRGFVAEVSTRGRLLASIEKDATWLYGVNPGAVAVDGDNLEAAHVQFRETLKETFVDFAAEADSFEAFKARVEGFVNAVNVETAAEWQEAVSVVRAAKLAVMQLDKLDADSTSVCVTVTKKDLEELTPKDNFTAVATDALSQAA